jgi:hypothetical protein
MKCPMCEYIMSQNLVCPKCKREWVRTGDEEAPLMSKPRMVRMISPIREGARLDDCIVPVAATKDKMEE